MLQQECAKTDWRGMQARMQDAGSRMQEAGSIMQDAGLVLYVVQGRINRYSSKPSVLLAFLARLVNIRQQTKHSPGPFVSLVFIAHSPGQRAKGVQQGHTSA